MTSHSLLLRIVRPVALPRNLTAIAFTACAAFAMCCASPAVVNAAPNGPPAARPSNAPVLNIDVVDRARGGAKQSVRLSVPLPDRGSASVDTYAGSSEYNVRVHREGAPETSGPLRIDLRRIDQRRHSDSAEQRSNIRLDIRVVLQRGERTLIAHLERPDGSTTDVSASLR